MLLGFQLFEYQILNGTEVSSVACVHGNAQRARLPLGNSGPTQLSEPHSSSVVCSMTSCSWPLLAVLLVLIRHVARLPLLPHWHSKRFCKSLILCVAPCTHFVIPSNRWKRGVCWAFAQLLPVGAAAAGDPQQVPLPQLPAAVQGQGAQEDEEPEDNDSSDMSSHDMRNHGRGGTGGVCRVQ